MKLKAVLFGLSLALPLVVLADGTNPFAGAYVGAGLGYTNTYTNIQIADDHDGIFSSLTAGKAGVSGQVLAGYNYALNDKWLVGVQAFFNDNSIQSSPSLTLGDTVWSATAKMGQVYGVDGVLGYAINPTAMLFGGLGVASGKLKISYDAAGFPSPNGSYKTTFTGLHAIVGAEEVLSDSFLVRESYDYVGNKSKEMARSNDFRFLFKPTQGTFMIDLIYSFMA